MAAATRYCLHLLVQRLGLGAALGEQLDARGIQRGARHPGALEICHHHVDQRGIGCRRLVGQPETVSGPAQSGQPHQHADLALVGAAEHRGLGLEAQHLGAPAEVGLEDLTHVHAAGDAQRIEHDVHRGAVGEERHVLLGHDPGDDTLVAVTAGHLVADRDLSLFTQVHLHQLDHAGRQLVGLEDLVDLILGLLFHPGPLPRRGVDRRPDPVVGAAIRKPQRLEIDLGEVDARPAGPAVSVVPAGRNSSTVPALSISATEFPASSARELVEHHLVDPVLLLVLDPAHFADPLAPVLLDDLVFDPAEDLDVDDGALHARRHLERAVLHVLGLLTEDGGQQLLFR